MLTGFLMATPNPFSSQGSTIVVDPGIDFQPEKCCTKCGKSFPGTATSLRPSNVVDSLLFVLHAMLQNLRLDRPDNNLNNDRLRVRRVAEKERCWVTEIRMCSGKRLGLRQKSL
jgi:hypothetical protein